MHSEDSYQTERMPRLSDLSLRWAHRPFCWFCHEAAQLCIKFTSNRAMYVPLCVLFEHRKDVRSNTLVVIILNEPRHDKTNKMSVRPRSAWVFTQSDQSSQCAKCVAEDPMFLHADSDDSDQTGRMSRLI